MKPGNIDKFKGGTMVEVMKAMSTSPVNVERTFNRRSVRRDSTSILYVLPAFAPLFVFWIAPTMVILVLSFAQWNLIGPMQIVGFQNYASLISDPNFMQSIRITLYFAAGSIFPTMLGGLLLAMLLQKRIRGAGIYQAIIFSPWVTPAVAISLVWSWIFDPNDGLANAVLNVFHLGPVQWLSSAAWAMPSVLIVTVWQNIGWAMVFYLVALRNVSRGLLDAGKVDGANRWQLFRHVTLPRISPTSFFLALVLTVNALQAFDQINVLTQGGPAGATTTLLYLYYQAAFQQFNIGQAAAVAVVVVLITLAISMIAFVAGRRTVTYD